MDYGFFNNSLQFDLFLQHMVVPYLWALPILAVVAAFLGYRISRAAAARVTAQYNKVTGRELSPDKLRNEDKEYYFAHLVAIAVCASCLLPVTFAATALVDYNLLTLVPAWLRPALNVSIWFAFLTPYLLLAAVISSLVQACCVWRIFFRPLKQRTRELEAQLKQPTTA